MVNFSIKIAILFLVFFLSFSIAPGPAFASQKPAASTINLSWELYPGPYCQVGLPEWPGRYFPSFGWSLEPWQLNWHHRHYPNHFLQKRAGKSVQEETPELNNFVIASFLFGALSGGLTMLLLGGALEFSILLLILGGLAALVLGIIGLIQIRRHPEKYTGKWGAIAGIMLGAIPLLFFGGFLLAFALAM